MLTFLAPYLLWGLLSLPLFYLLIRLLPPRPQEITFPAMALLQDMASPPPPPRQPPWWLLFLRLFAVTLLILAFAAPVLRHDGVHFSQSEAVILVSNGWEAAHTWPQQQAQLDLLLAEADQAGLKVLVQGTADPVQQARFASVSKAREQLAQLAPRPWPARPVATATALSNAFAAQHEVMDIFWLSSGLLDADKRTDFLSRLGALGQPQVFVPARHQLPVMITQATPAQGGYDVTLWRPQESSPQDASASLQTADGAFITRSGGQFKIGENELHLTLKLPTHPTGPGALVVDSQNQLGGWWGLSSLSGLPRVGLMTPPSNDFPLLDSGYYLTAALKETLTPQKLAASADPTGLDTLFITTQPDDVAGLQKWITQGGTAVFFAGPWLAGNRTLDDVLPVRLRPQPRQLAGALSWTGALQLGQATPDAPLDHREQLSDGRLPADVQVTTQLLPEQAPDVAARTWLTLSDGTPLVTGVKMGRGWSVLVHVTADARWSSLPLSGYFVTLLNNLLTLSQAQDAAAQTAFPLPPWRLLHADGTLASPGAISAAPLPAANTPVSAAQPAGFYGPARQPFVHQLSPAARQLTALTPSNLQGLVSHYYNAQAQNKPFQPLLLGLALLLLALDSLLRLRRWPTTAVGGALLLATLLLPTVGHAASLPSPLPKGAYQLQLAWLDTGNSNLNTIAKQGLSTLSEVLTSRTTVEPAPPRMLNPETDELGFYPIIFWPIAPHPKFLTPLAATRLKDYLDNGGLLVIDGQTALGASQQATQLILTQMLPLPLRQLDDKHVLNRSFYLLKGQFPGRLAGNPVWIENTTKLTRLIVGENDWLGAWAYDAAGKPMQAVTPGGNSQRAQAFQVGVNLVMFALLGDYKADQLHVDTLLQQMEDAR